jgi:small subunit ribosomal protein S17
MPETEQQQTTMETTEQRSRRKVRLATVVSDKMDKTVVVQVTDRKSHPLYKKVIQHRVRFKAHDEGNECKVGDLVRIMETRPLSRDKRWRVVEVVEKAR